MSAEGRSIKAETYNEIMWEARIKRLDGLEEGYLLGGERDLQRFDVFGELLDFPSAKNWENIWGLVHHIGDSNCEWSFVIPRTRLYEQGTHQLPKSWLQLH